MSEEWHPRSNTEASSRAVLPSPEDASVDDMTSSCVDASIVAATVSGKQAPSHNARSASQSPP
jgi:hypothetical protein